MIYIVVLEREGVRGTKGGGGARPATRNARRAVSSRARKRTERSKRRACNRVGVKGWGKGVRVSAMFAHELFSLRGLASVTQKSSRAMTCYAAAYLVRSWSYAWYCGVYGRGQRQVGIATVIQCSTVKVVGL